jgi:hypothetical protein
MTVRYVGTFIFGGDFKIALDVPQALLPVAKAGASYA